MTTEEELIREMVKNGIVSKEQAEIEIAKIRKSREHLAASIVAKTKTAKTRPVAEKKQKRAGEETLGSFAARSYCQTIELAPGEFFSVSELIDGINAVKIKDKAVDLVKAYTTGCQVNQFCNLGLEHIARKDSLCARDFYETLSNGSFGKEYSEGTSRAQSQQVFSLFRTFKIVNNNGSLNKQSPLLMKLMKE